MVYKFFAIAYIEFSFALTFSVRNSVSETVIYYRAIMSNKAKKQEPRTDEK